MFCSGFRKNLLAAARARGERERVRGERERSRGERGAGGVDQPRAAAIRSAMPGQVAIGSVERTTCMPASA